MSETQHELDSDNGIYRALLESTLAIPWKIDWASMKFTYIGPQIEQLQIGRASCRERVWRYV